MSLETELAVLFRRRPAFWTPIAAAYSIDPSVVPPVDTRILQRLCYGNAPENAAAAPYLVWTGPFDYDQGTVSQGAIATKIAKFWLTAYSQYLDDCSNWINTIENDLLALFTTQGHYEVLPTVRIMSMIYQRGSKFPSGTDQTLRTGQEFPTNGFTICYQICWQPLS